MRQKLARSVLALSVFDTRVGSVLGFWSSSHHLAVLSSTKSITQNQQRNSFRTLAHAAQPSWSTGFRWRGTKHKALPAGSGETRGEYREVTGNLGLHSMATPNDDKHWPSSLRNRVVISTELTRWLQPEGGGSGGAKPKLLEIASGTGCHVEAFTKCLPGWTFSPTEHDEERIPDIEAVIPTGGYTNICPPQRLDVCADPSEWPRPPTGAADESAAQWDAIFCANMIHIAPPECTPGLLTGAASQLKMGGHLFIYGPFALSGLLAPESNQKFDESLKARSNGAWGIKDAALLADLGDERGLELTAMTAMPANNFFVVFTKVREPGSTAAAISCEARTSRVADRVAAVITPAKEALMARLAAE